MLITTSKKEHGDYVFCAFRVVYGPREHPLFHFHLQEGKAKRELVCEAMMAAQTPM